MDPVRKEIETQIQKLPEKCSAGEIEDMYNALKIDLTKLQKIPGMTQSKILSLLCHKHKKFQFGYPGIFAKTLRGELDEESFKSMLDIKTRLDFGDIDMDTARNQVIDGAKKKISKNPKESRPQKIQPKGSVVQELKFSAKPDDS